MKRSTRQKFEKKKTIAFSVDAEIARNLEKLSLKLDITKSAIISQALAKFLKEKRIHNTK